MKAYGCTGMKIDTNGEGPITKMAAIPVYGKPFKKSSSLEPMPNCNETWYVAFGTPAHHSLFEL